MKKINSENADNIKALSLEGKIGRWFLKSIKLWNFEWNITAVIDSV